MSNIRAEIGNVVYASAQAALSSLAGISRSVMMRFPDHVLKVRFTTNTRVEHSEGLSQAKVDLVEKEFRAWADRSRSPHVERVQNFEMVLSGPGVQEVSCSFAWDKNSPAGTMTVRAPQAGKSAYDAFLDAIEGDQIAGRLIDNPFWDEAPLRPRPVLTDPMEQGKAALEWLATFTYDGDRFLAGEGVPAGATRELHDLIGTAIGMARRLRPEFFDLLFLPLQEELAQAVVSLRDGLERVFDAALADPFKGDIGDLTTAMKVAVGRFATSLSMVLPHVSAKQLLEEDPRDIEDELAKAQAAVDRAHSIVAEAEETRKALDDRVGEIQQALGLATTGEQAEHFGATANGHRAALVLPLFGALLSFAILVYTAMTGHQRAAEMGAWDGPGQAAVYFAGKATVGLGLLTVFFVCLRVALSHKHNEIVNRHRQNALMTYERFLASAESDEARALILTKAVETIYTPQPTAFSKVQETQMFSVKDAATAAVSRASPG